MPENEAVLDQEGNPDAQDVETKTIVLDTQETARKVSDSFQELEQLLIKEEGTEEEGTGESRRLLIEELDAHGGLRLKREEKGS